MERTPEQRDALKAASDEILLKATAMARKVCVERGLDPNDAYSLGVRIDAFQRLVLALAQAVGFDVDEVVKQIRKCERGGIAVTEYEDERVRLAANSLSELNESGFEPGKTLH